MIARNGYSDALLKLRLAHLQQPVEVLHTALTAYRFPYPSSCRSKEARGHSCCLPDVLNTLQTETSVMTEDF